LATLSSTHATALLHDHRSAASALTSGYHFAWTIGTGLLIAAIAASLAVLRSAGVAAPAGKIDAQVEKVTPDPTFREAA
jgi:hypothetical protein